VKLLSLCLCVASTSASAADIAVFPAVIRLTGPEARQTILVQEADGHLIGFQVRDGVTFQSSNEAVAKVDGGVVIPTGNGEAVITVAALGTTKTIPVIVAEFDQPHVWSFRNQVQSILTKAGCNSGACHGAVAGKNGFKLSLRGYDPPADFDALTRQARGRRIVPHDPGRSLMLTKPTGVIPHKGGLRFEEGSLEYRVLSEWIAQGHPGPKPDDPRIERLEILPPTVRLKPGDEQQMLVLAHFSDGRIEDVTRWAKYTSTNFSVAQVEDGGRVKVTGNGEGSIAAWYLAQNVLATITSPYQQDIDPRVFAEAPQANVIDNLVLAKLQALNLAPSPRCTDGEFLRRAFLDTIGVLPTAEETREFLSRTDPDKRADIIARLLTRPEFVDYWTYQWCDLLLVSGNKLRPPALEAFYGWLRERVQADTPWNEIVRGILLAKGSAVENGAANFYSLHQDPQEMSETVSMAFLGMSIGCARCHDHPLEKWTNDDYYGMVSLFARVRGKGWGGDRRSGDGNRIIFLADYGEVIQPRTGKPQLPRPLDGAPLAFDDLEDRRVHLVDWLTAPENPYFSRAIVNRIWANYFGIGLVDKVDDLRLTNPASNEPLLSLLANDLARDGYNLKSLMRQILLSEAYQRSSVTLPQNAADERYHARAYPRRLKAEVLLDAVSQVTGVATPFKNAENKDLPAGTRALQLHDTAIASYFLETFGRPERVLTCTCERTDEPSMTQVLHLANGKTLAEKLESGENRIANRLADSAAPPEIIEDLYLTALSRHPTADEMASLSAVLSAAPAEEKRAVVEDLYWSVLTSREFLFQH
jgi:hypothetical protein